MGDVTLSGRWFQNKDIILGISVSEDGALVSIPYNVEATHAGMMFYASIYNSAVASTANLDILLVSSATKHCHFAVDANSGGSGTLSIYEGVTYSAAGSALIAFNANRQSLLTSDQVFTSGPTITGTGTTLIQDFVPGGTTGNALGGSSANIARVTEFVCKLNTAYLFRFNNITNAAQPVSLTVGYFEGGAG